MTRMFTVLTFLALSSFPTSSWAGDFLSFKDWTVIDGVTGQTLEADQAPGEELQLASGQRAFLDGIYAEDFTIEVDISASGMPGIGFRAVDMFSYDYVLFRTAMTSADRALQYLPVYHGAAAWQLYPHYQAPADIAPDNSFHVALACSGRQCTLSVNDGPLFRFETEKDRARGGFFFLRSSAGPATFSNLKIDNAPVEKNVSVVRPVSNFLDRWQISPQLDLTPTSPLGSIARTFETVQEWRDISADENGIVNLAKYFELPEKAVFARTIIERQVPGVEKLEFDYAHFMTIMLNGEVIFSGREMDTDNFFRVVLGEERIDLPLQAGSNELVFLIFGYDLSHNPTVLGRHQYDNWGYTARLAGEDRP